MTDSRSDFIRIRGLRYHVRRWGPPDAPMILAAHGWMDVSATFDPVARRLSPHFQFLMPDWRGFGHTEWPADGYWFPDYVGDLDALVDHYVPPGRAVLLAGHSMGAQIVSLYAGLRPERVAKLAILDGLFLPDVDVKITPQKYRQWLDAIQSTAEVPSYRSYEELASRVQRRHPRLSAEQCLFIARCWGRKDAQGVVWLMADPKHLLDMPRPYRQDESDAIWARITAPTLFVDAGASGFSKTMAPGELARRRAFFRHHRATTIEGSGHMLHFEAPQALADTLRTFFAG